jgi:hypothetical protein
MIGFSGALPAIDSGPFPIRAELSKNPAQNLLLPPLMIIHESRGGCSRDARGQNSTGTFLRLATLQVMKETSGPEGGREVRSAHEGRVGIPASGHLGSVLYGAFGSRSALLDCALHRWCGSDRFPLRRGDIFGIPSGMQLLLGGRRMSLTGV